VYLIFADDIKLFVLKIRFKVCAVLQYDAQFKHGWCAANCKRLNKVITFTETTTAVYCAC